MSEHQKHHFVPQFYLRNFAADAKQRQIGLFHIQNQLYVPHTSIRSQAQKHKLYGDKGGEEAFCELEGVTSPIVRHAITHSELPDRHSPEHYTLLIFMLLQASRTPMAAAEAEEMINKMTRTIAALHPQMAEHAQDLHVELHNPVGWALGVAAECYPMITDLALNLLTNTTSIPLITSDHPVVFYNRFMERRQKFGSSTGLASKGLQLFLPLSPTTCLIGYDDGVYRLGGRARHRIGVPLLMSDVRWLNALQAGNAHEQLFFGATASESEIRQTVERASPWRSENRTSVNTYPRLPLADEGSSALIHTSKVDLRVGLSLSCVGEHPSAQSYELGNRVVHRRNPELCALHDEFLRAVDANKFKPSGFAEFLRSKFPPDDKL